MAKANRLWKLARKKDFLPKAPDGYQIIHRRPLITAVNKDGEMKAWISPGKMETGGYLEEGFWFPKDEMTSEEVKRLNYWWYKE